MGSTFGKNIRVSVFGQSHSPGIGVVVDGLPAGFQLDTDKLQAFLARRAPGQSSLSTHRQEKDKAEILSGLYDGKTCGAPLSAIIRNYDARPKDYSNLASLPRPGHADYPAHIKYHGFEDKSGGGHFSGRLTAPLCIAGGIALQMLEAKGIRIAAHLYSIHDVEDTPFDAMNPQIAAIQPGYLSVISQDAGQRMAEIIDQARMDKDSVGGVIECAATGLPVGLGESMFEGLENRLAAALFGIPAVKGVEFGAGFAATKMRGSQHNDPFRYENGQVVTTNNRHGGILGGISTGMPLVFRCAFKPTSSVYMEQDTVDLDKKENATLAVKGRHDPCVVPRAVPVVEAVTALVLLDSYLDHLKEEHPWT